MKVKSLEGQENYEKKSTKIVEVKKGESLKKIDTGVIYLFTANIILSNDDAYNRYLRDYLRGKFQAQP